MTDDFRSHLDGSSDSLSAAIFAISQSWAQGVPPDLRALWRGVDPRLPIDVLTFLVKADLRVRHHLGERPDITEYLRRFPELRDHRDRVVSLVYEEYCLLEEKGEAPDPDSFCDRYDPWRDSLASQLRYHRVLSLAAGYQPAPPKFPDPGDRFQNFRLESILGRGGSALVFKALDESLGNRVVALKISCDLSKDTATQGRLDHDHIVPVHSVAHDPTSGFRALVMPFRPGKSLDAVIRQIDPENLPRDASFFRDLLPAPSDSRSRDTAAARWRDYPSSGTFEQGAAWVALIIARALDYAHSENVYHRDVKPANILLTSLAGPQLLDFNLSHEPHAADQAGAAKSGGTLPYMAPEQLQAFIDPAAWENVGPTADIYSLGLVLVELLTGRRSAPPSPVVSLPQAVQEMLDYRRLPHASLAATTNHRVPAALDAIIAKCLEFERSDRYSSAADLADDLKRFLEPPPPEPTSPSEPLVATASPSRPRTWRDPIAAPVATLILAGLVWWGWSQFHGRSDLTVGESLAPASSPDLLTPRSVLSLLDLGAMKLKEGRPDIAVKCFKQFVASFPNDPRGYRSLAKVALQGCNFEQSRSFYDLAVLTVDLQGKSKDDDDSKLVDSLRDRAIFLVQHGKSLQTAGQADYQTNVPWELQPEKSRRTVIQAKDLFEDALADLERMKKCRWKGAETGVPFTIELQSTLAYVGLGDCATAQDAIAESLGFYRSAKQAITTASTLKHDEDVSLTRLIKVVDQRIHDSEQRKAVKLSEHSPR